MKQKLIDANNIEYHKVWIETLVEGQHDGCIMAYKNQIDSLPTIEAVPIKWIKNWLNNCNPDENCVENLLFEWECEEKENERV